MSNNPTLLRKEVLDGPVSQVQMRAVPPLTERNTTDRVEDKKVLFVFCDSHYDSSIRFLSDMGEHLLLPSRVSTMRWSEFISSLPTLSADIILINSLPPSTLLENNALISNSFREFKARNPSSTIVMVNLYGFSTPAGQVFGALSKDNLVDEIHDGPISVQHLLNKGVTASEFKGC